MINKDSTIIITGASSGLGKAISLIAADMGLKVVLIARNLEKLNAVADEIKSKGSHPYIFQFDLEKVCEIKNLYEDIKNKVGIPTILVNNAGYNAVGFICNTPFEVYEKNYKVNTLSHIELMHNVLPDMMNQNKGYIVNIMSAAMYHSFPAMSSYYSTKSALKAVHESLKAEVHGYNIGTLLVDPGGFSSNYWNNLDKGNRLGEYQYPKHRNDKQPQIVAKKIFKAIENNQEEVSFPGIKDKIGYYLNIFCPKLVDKLIIKRNVKLLSYRSKFK